MNKKYTSIKKDLLRLVADLEDNPFVGESLGKGFYKVRMAITSKGHGKSFGARVVTYIAVVENTVYLASIYDKSDKENISKNELNSLLKQLPKQ